MLVIHTMGGTLAGSDSWFANPASQVSSHYGIGLLGQKHQYVHLNDQAWVNGRREYGNRWNEVLDAAGITSSWQRALNPNQGTVGIETEDKNNPHQVVTDAQYAATLEVCLGALFYKPTIKVVTTHHIISPQTRPNCAGKRWVASGALARLARELGLQLVV